MFGSKNLIIAIAMMLMAAATLAHAQNKPLYQGNMDWAWNNWPAGGSVDCPQLYFASGVPQYIAAGGRAGVMRQAAVLASGNPAYAFQLVLLTQCHNGGALSSLVQAGPQQVIPYLLWLGATQTIQ